MKSYDYPIKVCVVIPAYNEGRVIYDVIQDAKKSFKNSNFDVDFLVVNDGSIDNTGSESIKAGAHVINHILNCGAGAATSTGLSYARQNGYVVAATMDADGQHKPEDVMQGLAELLKRKSDLLIGSRLIESDISDMTWLKLFGNKALSVITFILFGVKVTDSQSGLRIFSSRALHELRWKTNGYEFCSEMIWRAYQLGLIVDEYPIKAVYTEYSRSKGQNNWNGVNILKSLIKRRLVELFE